VVPEAEQQQSQDQLLKALCLVEELQDQVEGHAALDENMKIHKLIHLMCHASTQFGTIWDNIS
jgi:hypothetical protein